MTSITPSLWFDGDAEEAVDFYTGLFGGEGLTASSRYGEGAPFPAGTIVGGTFEILGQRLSVINGGPQFPFTEAVSFVVDCADQAEVDRYWSALTADGGEESQCGWLKDRFGLSWQIVPVRLFELLSDPDPERAGRAMQAMLQMRKIVVSDLEKAADAS